MEIIPLQPRQRESAILLMSDIHYGKKTDTYDTDVCRKRLRYLGNKLGDIRELLRGYDFDEFVPCLMGDLNDGTEIFPGQTHYQSQSNVNAQATEVAIELADWARQQKKIWGNVRFECIPGNHGRASKFAHEAANWDLVAYQYLKMRLEKDGIPVNYNRPDQDTFVRKIEVRKHPILLYHGQDIKMYQTIPWYGLFTRAVRWGISQYAPFEIMAMGHFHSFGTWQLNSVRAYMSGTMVSGDWYPLRTLGMESSTTWWLFGVSDRYASTWNFAMELEIPKSSKPRIKQVYGAPQQA